MSAQPIKTDTLSWSGLTLTHQPTRKPILNNMEGCVQSGQLLCIMGPSGAGKSSLLSILTGRLTKQSRVFQLEGSILMNQQTYDAYDFGKFGAYVRQDDLLMATLTVQETFQFQAWLKMADAPDEEKNSTVQRMLRKLELYECKDVQVGSQFSKSISGGQRKRVAIGIELLSNPICLILDEPTSGLDSSIALKLIRLLKQLTLEGKMIITTIHQPSTLIFNELKSLLLLSKGETVSQGKAKDIVPYMERIGVSVNKKMNPADFFMLEISDSHK